MIQMDLSFASIPNPDGRLIQIRGERKWPFHVKKCSIRGNRVVRVAQLNHVFDPGVNVPDGEDNFELDHLFEEEKLACLMKNVLIHSLKT